MALLAIESIKAQVGDAGGDFEVTFSTAPSSRQVAMMSRASLQGASPNRREVRLTDATNPTRPAQRAARSASAESVRLGPTQLDSEPADAS